MYLIVGLQSDYGGGRSGSLVREDLACSEQLQRYRTLDIYCDFYSHKFFVLVVACVDFSSGCTFFP
jgi:hypothetical protein